jgi:hypothetical protein
LRGFISKPEENKKLKTKQKTTLVHVFSEFPVLVIFPVLKPLLCCLQGVFYPTKKRGVNALSCWFNLSVKPVHFTIILILYSIPFIFKKG